MRRIVQIVPRLPRAEGGVGGYAHALAGRLRETFGIETRFAEVDDAETVELAAGETVLLHYVNYAYQRRGCPARLVAGLEAWKRSGGGRLVTVFHEVYAGGPAWRSSFWLGPVQRRLAARVARASDRLVTTLALYAGLVRRLVPGADVEVAPVFSTVGEPPQVPSFGERPKTMIVFGGAGVRRRAWGEHRRDLLAACRSLGIREVLDVGPATGLPAELNGIPVRVLGPLPEDEVSRRMLGAAAGFLAYPSAFLPKSTVYAAYCAHGLLPVWSWNASSRGGSGRWRGGSTRPVQDGLALPGRVEPPPSRPDPPLLEAGDDPAAAAAAARTWYLEHSLERQGEMFRRLLEGAA